MPPARTGAPPQGGAARTGTLPRACRQLGDRPDAVREARRFVTDEVARRLGDAHAQVADDAALVAAELLANACQHGASPIAVCVSGTAERVRVEVSDASPRLPVRLVRDTAGMTGRGLAVVEAVTAHWGAHRTPDGGKTVWAELVAARPAEGAPGEAEADAESIDALLAGWDDDDPAPEPEPRFGVVLGDVPTDLLLQAKAHIDNLVREFSLAAAADRDAHAEVPEHLARLIETVVHGFSDARDAIKRQALAAARRSEPRTKLTLHLPLSAAGAGEAYLAALDEADEYSRAARLLTLETPPDHRLFRRWYVEAVIRQLRELAAGHAPAPATPFEDVLVAEIRRLASAQRVSERAARLQRVSAALANCRTPEDVAHVVVSEGVDTLRASGGGLLVPAPDGEHLAVPGAVGYGDELMGALREEPLDAPLPAAAAMRTGQAVWLETPQERDREFPALHGFETGTIAMCAVPLVVGHRLLGALRFSFGVRKLFDEAERAFVLALAAQTAQTLHRTELYEAERAASLELQRALLPERLPEIAGWQLAAYYSPADGQQAGGDFYDVLPLRDGRIAVIVGDVMGRGVPAAAMMGQVRATLRAYAIADPDPAAVAGRVDHYFATLEVDQLVTALYLLLDPATGAVEITNVGHLPPLLVEARGSHVLAFAGGPPFGLTDEPRPTTTLTLDPGAALVLATDGLVERRGEDIDIGIGRALAAAAGAPSGADPLLAAILAVDGTQGDDVTAVVLHRDATRP